MRAMINISESAKGYFKRLLQTQGDDAVGIRLSAVNPGTPRADARLEFCDHGDLMGDEWAIDCDGFVLYVDAPRTGWLDAAEIDFVNNATGGQLTIRAPKIKGDAPAEGASMIERVQWLLETEINPQKGDKRAFNPYDSRTVARRATAPGKPKPPAKPRITQPVRPAKKPGFFARLFGKK